MTQIVGDKARTAQSLERKIAELEVMVGQANRGGASPPMPWASTAAPVVRDASYPLSVGSQSPLVATRAPLEAIRAISPAARASSPTPSPSAVRYIYRSPAAQPRQLSQGQQSSSLFTYAAQPVP